MVERSSAARIITRAFPRRDTCGNSCSPGGPDSGEKLGQNGDKPPPPTERRRDLYQLAQNRAYEERVLRVHRCDVSVKDGQTLVGGSDHDARLSAGNFAFSGYY
jgi:hypothetical protein